MPRPADQKRIVEDFVVARSHLVQGLSLKLCFWQALPWKLCGGAVADPSVARLTLSQCVALFESEPTSPHHEITRQFLDPHYTGESPLRPLVGRLVGITHKL